jgi:hypothetical protein
VITLAINIGQELLLDPTTGSTVSKYKDIGQLVTIILKNGLTIAGIILVALIIFGGVSYIYAAGESDQKKLAAAQEMLTSALIGFLVVFASYFIIQIVTLITGIQIL